MTNHDYAGILFLDFDGVLNNMPYLRSLRSQGIFAEASQAWRDLMPEKVKMINKFIEDENLAIVLSTAWRTLFDYDDILGWLNSLGEINPDRVIGMTPRGSWFNNRGEEIREWLQTYQTDLPFVVVDDMSSLNFDAPFDNDNVSWHLIRTDDETGITEETMKLMKEVLEGR